MAEESSLKTQGHYRQKVFEYLGCPKKPAIFRLQPTLRISHPDSAVTSLTDETAYNITVHRIGRPQSRLPADGKASVAKGRHQLSMTDTALVPPRTAVPGLFRYSGHLLLLLPALALGGIAALPNAGVPAGRRSIALRSRRVGKWRNSLSTAEQHLDAGAPGAFYDEVSKAHAGRYVCDCRTSRSSLFPSKPTCG